MMKCGRFLIQKSCRIFLIYLAKNLKKPTLKQKDKPFITNKLKLVIYIHE